MVDIFSRPHTLTFKISLNTFPQSDKCIHGTGWAVYKGGKYQPQNPTVLSFNLQHSLHNYTKKERRGEPSCERKKTNPLFYSPRHLMVIRRHDGHLQRSLERISNLLHDADQAPEALGLPIPNRDPFQQASLVITTLLWHKLSPDRGR